MLLPSPSAAPSASCLSWREHNCVTIPETMEHTDISRPTNVACPELGGNQGLMALTALLEPTRQDNPNPLLRPHWHTKRKIFDQETPPRRPKSSSTTRCCISLLRPRQVEEESSWHLSTLSCCIRAEDVAEKIRAARRILAHHNRAITCSFLFPSRLMQPSLDPEPQAPQPSAVA